MEPVVVGALIGFGATFAAATTTQVLASRRQTADLEARLAADRELRDLDEARRVIDVALEQVRELDARLYAVQRAAQAPELDALEHPEYGDDPQRLLDRLGQHRDGLDVALQAFHAAARGALLTGSQLEIRFGRNDLVAYYQEAITAFVLAATNGIRRRPGNPDSEPDWPHFVSHVERAAAARRCLVDEGRRIVGVTLAPREASDVDDVAGFGTSKSTMD